MTEYALSQAAIGQISDGYHTFDELYAHRAHLFATLTEDMGWRSRLHADGTMFEGMFIAGVELLDGQHITYHQDLKYWDLFKHTRTLERAPEYDGHTSDDVLRRIARWLEP